jgi:hypothetical protein
LTFVWFLWLVLFFVPYRLIPPQLALPLKMGQYRQSTHPYRPDINCDAKDARTTFITRGIPRFRKDEWPNPGRFLDVGTLLFSLFDKHTSLDQWCAEFQRKGYAIDRKLEHQPSGKLSQSELRYCKCDVKITQQLLNATKREFDRHPVPKLLPDKAYSPASLAKAYMREMNIIKPRDKFKVSDEVLGIAMQAYFGGRAEVHIRRTRVPVGCDKLWELPALSFSSTLLELFREFFPTFKFRNGERPLGPSLVRCGLPQGEPRSALPWR